MIQRRNLLLVLIVLASLGIRCAYLPPRDGLEPDAAITYRDIAHNIVDHGRWFYVNSHVTDLLRVEALPTNTSLPSEFRVLDQHPRWQPYVIAPVGPALLLAGAWTVFGHERALPVLILQIISDTLVVLLIYWIALLLFKRRRAALIAAALYAIYPPIAQQTSFINIDLWAIDFTVVILALYLQALRSPVRLRWLLACGLVTGFGTFFRPNLLLLVPVFALAAIPWDGWRRPLRNASVVTLVALVPLIPWTIRNIDTFHAFIPLRSGVGITLTVGLAEVHNTLGLVGNEAQIYARVHRARPDLVYLTPAYDDYLRAQAVKVIEHHPVYYAKLVARRIVLSTIGEYSSDWMYKDGESPVLYRTLTGGGPISYVVHRPLDFLESMLQPAVFLLAMLALLWTWRGRRREHVLLLALLLVTLVPYWIIHSEARYVLPTAVVYLLWISLGADLLLERLRLLLRAPAGIAGRLRPRDSAALR